MIRRNLSNAAGESCWALIAQRDHAEISGRLAEHWGAGGVIPLDPRDDVLFAVFHHDDGWPVWDAEPDVDPHSGRPLDFTEMPLEAALAIWQQSIDVAAHQGPLPGYLVAGHFCALLARSDRAERPAAVAFLDEQGARRRVWLAEWQSLSPERHAPAVAQRGLEHVQLFDLLSLWLCCAERTEPWTVETPGGVPITLSPRPADEAHGQIIEIAPWPLKVPHLDLTTAARSIPAIAYPNRQALATAPATHITLHWRLEPPATD